MSPKALLAALSVACVTPIANAGEFRMTDEDAISVSATYSGFVSERDLLQWWALEDYCEDRVLLLTIESGGGSAFGGLELYWALEAHPRLVTIAGGEVGAVIDSRTVLVYCTDHLAVG